MTQLKVVPIDIARSRRDKLVRALGAVLARVGFARADVLAVAEEAGVEPKYVYKYFGGLNGMAQAYGQCSRFWPTADELLGGDEADIRRMPPGELMGAFFKRYLRALLRRPETLAILAWEAVERNDLARALEGVRARTALEFFERMEQDPPEDVDLTAVVILMAGAVHFMAVRSRVHSSLGGVDLQSEEGWKRIEATIDVMLGRTLDRAS